MIYIYAFSVNPRLRVCRSSSMRNWLWRRGTPRRAAIPPRMLKVAVEAGAAVTVPSGVVSVAVAWLLPSAMGVASAMLTTWARPARPPCSGTPWREPPHRYRRPSRRILYPTCTRALTTTRAYRRGWWGKDNIFQRLKDLRCSGTGENMLLAF